MQGHHDAGRLAARLTGQIRGVMEEAARVALLPRFRTLADTDREEKSPGELVTVADRECEALLSDALARLLSEASIVGEEAAHSAPEVMGRLADELCWVIDPLDGTGYFAAGQEPFGIMIALAAGGRAVGGWIFDPLSGRFCWAALGEGCWVGEQRIRTDTGAAATTIGLSPLLQRRPERFAAVHARMAGRLETHEIPRCAAAHYPAMLLGAPALTYYERTLPWDHAPGALMIEEAGGRVARLDGSPYRLDEDRIGLLAATDAASWDEIAALLQDLPE
ncbi:inositol monophosphatase family protein [Sphingomonas humi]|uniref:Inositol monophosphatase family protein n=1 Tax=Sphingomonas humi TaxID=335630 RepID=A0ABP7S2Z0_9SPHN